jgi:ABC-type transport system involved in multi-copper enzyme maturation permease subunit
MAVYKRNYRSYSGPLTPMRSRWLVITRHSLAEVFESRVSVVLFVVCLVPALLAALVIYVANSETARLVLNLGSAPAAMIDHRFFFRLLELQSWLALFLTAWIGPAMVSPDLTNGGLPLFLSRPISRAGYVAGKLLVLGIVLSAVTWIPSLFLFGLQAQLANGWLSPNLYMVPAIIFGGVLWITVLAMLALAVSAWVRWRIVATGLMVALILIPAGFGAVISAVLRTPWGFLLNIPYMLTVIWSHLLRAPIGWHRAPLPVTAAWFSLLGVCALCLVMLNKRIMARQVVRG